MDIKLTKKRLNDHLSYDWWKYLAVIAASIFFWSLVFTMASPRLAMSKKLEIFFIVNGFSTENTDSLRNGLKGYLSEEFVEIHFNNYTPNDSTTSQVLSARVGVREGDLYAFPFSSQNDKNTMGGYADNGLFKDFGTIIADAKHFSQMTYEEFAAAYGNTKEFDTEEKRQKGYALCARAGEQAEKLEGYINLYGGENGKTRFSINIQGLRYITAISLTSLCRQKAKKYGA
jgi:hypothetical protein